MTGPVEKTVIVPLDPMEAFRLFTEGMDRWWPKDSHSTSAGDGETAREVVVEPHEGGRILETRHDGAVSEWGRITEWRPGERLRFTWHPGRAEAEATELEVAFVADAIGCRVDLVHSGFDRLGARASTVANSYDSGWTLVLALFVRQTRPVHA